MENWEFCFISILFLIKVPHIQTGCSWESQKNCSIKCVQKNMVSPEKIEKVMEILEKERTNSEHADCQEDGIDLSLELFEYPKDVMKMNFFTTQWKVRELSISFSTFISKVKKIEVDAFNVDALKSLKKLVLTNLNVSPISKGIFNGLESLEVLNIQNAMKLMVIEEGVLDVLNQTLKEFSLEELEQILVDNNEILIDGLTGAEQLEKLENVKFRYKLHTSIGQKSFKGLTNTKILDLSKCRIETIGVGAFDPMTALEILKLENNLITTIPEGFFNTISIRNKTQIFLGENKWLCDCSLMPFKVSLMEHSNFVGELKCDKPDKFKDHKIRVLNFCDSTTSTTTSITSLTTPYAPMQECTSPVDSESEYVVIEPQKQSMEVLETDDGDVILRVDKLKENGILIWFLMNKPISYFNASNEINCQIGSGTSFLIKNLKINSVYNFCLMESTKVTMSPLDCISYLHKKSDSRVVPWILNDKKGRTIGITSVACGVSIVLGFLTGILVYKLKTFWTNRNESFIRRYKSSRANSIARSRLSVMTSDSYTTRRTTNTTVQYFLDGNYDAPPLPARPVSMYLMDEPVYATIRDFASLRDGTKETVLN